jgi:hypothetical protein
MRFFGFPGVDRIPRKRVDATIPFTVHNPERKIIQAKCQDTHSDRITENS